MKKFIAILLTLSMVLSLFAVPVSANPGGSGAFEVDGQVVLLPHVYAVTLPTTAFTIVVDPEGVVGANTAGTVTFTNGTPRFINRSSVAIQLGVEARVTTGTTPATQVGVVGTSGAVGTAGSTTRNAYIHLTPSTENVGTSGTVEFAGVANRTAVVAEPTLFTFVLPAANFNVTGELGPENDGLGTLARSLNASTPNLQGTRIQLAGRVTPNPTIWTNEAALGVRLRFSWVPAPSPAPGTAIDGSAHLRLIQSNTEIGAMIGGGPSANATISANAGVDTITITNATGFTFPNNGAGITLTAQRASTDNRRDTAALTSATITGGGDTLTIVLANTWSSGGTNMARADVGTVYTLTWGDYKVEVIKPVANATTVEEVKVTIAS